MDREPQSDDALAHLLEQLAQAGRERARLRKNIARLEQRDESIRIKEMALKNQIHAFKIQNALIPRPTKSAPSVRSADQMRAWAALYEALQSLKPGKVLHQAECALIIGSAVPNCPSSKIRSHLHRFKRNGLIAKSGSGWALAPTQSEKGKPRSSSGPDLP